MTCDLRSPLSASWSAGFLLAGLLLSCGPLCADVVTLKDGTQREGTVVEENDREVTLEVQSGALKGKVVLPRAEIRSIRRGPLPENPARKELTALRDRARALKGAEAVEAWMALGEAARNQVGFSSEAQEAFRQVLELQPDHAQARARLGYVKTERGWEALEAERREHGLVPLDEVWVKPEERAWLIDRRHLEETEDLRIGPRPAEGFKRGEVEQALKLKRAQDDRARARIRLEDGDELLGRYGYFGQEDGLYIGSSNAPYYADGVGIRYGDSSAWFGTVGYPGYRYYGDYGYGPHRVTRDGTYRTHPNFGGPLDDGHFGHGLGDGHGHGFSPGIVYHDDNFGFAFGTNFSGYGGGYGGYGLYFSGGSKHFNYKIGIGGYGGHGGHGYYHH